VPWPRSRIDAGRGPGRRRSWVGCSLGGAAALDPPLYCNSASGRAAGSGRDPKGIALTALKEIEFDRETGKLSDADYELLKAKYTGVALEALRLDSAAAEPEAGSDDVETMIAAKVRALRSASAPAPSDARFHSPAAKQKPAQPAALGRSPTRSSAPAAAAACPRAWRVTAAGLRSCPTADFATPAGSRWRPDLACKLRADTASPPPLVASKERDAQTADRADPVRMVRR
jgi:hypothetical protein